MTLQELPHPPKGAGSEPVETPPDNDRDAVSVEDLEDDAPLTENEALQKAKAYFSAREKPTWADHVLAEEGVLHQKMAKLRAARLGRDATLQQ